MAKLPENTKKEQHHIFINVKCALNVFAIFFAPKSVYFVNKIENETKKALPVTNNLRMTIFVTPYMLHWLLAISRNFSGSSHL